MFFKGNLDELKRVVQYKKLIVWGAGKALNNLWEDPDYKEILKHAAYVVDSSKKGELSLSGKKLPVFNVEKLLDEKDGIVLVNSVKYAFEIFEQIKSLDLPKSLIIAFRYLIMRIPRDNVTDEVKKVIGIFGEEKIPRLIHTFWFSGDPVPEEYKRCIDSWKKYCPDYEIRIWDQDNYDCDAHPFVREAVKNRKWAFAADHARLDVLYKYGGVYMDMDYELCRSLDGILCNNAVFAHAGDKIDLAFFASAGKNPLLMELSSVYDKTEFSASKEVLLNKLRQPELLKNIFYDKGVIAEDRLQVLDDMLVLPGFTFFPWYWFDKGGVEPLTECSFGIHHCNAGWFEEDAIEQREVKIEDIKKFWNGIMHG